MELDRHKTFIFNGHVEADFRLLMQRKVVLEQPQLILARTAANGHDLAAHWPAKESSLLRITT